MGVITPDRFNPIKSYCNVRLQQGVPLVDADVNELDDIRKFEVRAFLRWFVGNGIPEGNDGFRIAPTPSPTDFQILAGAQLTSGSAPPAPSPAMNRYALQELGRCLVDGLDVIIQSDIGYAAQTLSPVDLAPPYSLPTVASIPAVTGPVLVYLDIWERVVAPTEDPSLVVPPLGTESCARIKRQWVVRTRVGSSAPVSGDLDFIDGHLYYGLAVLQRPPGASIQAANITDVRERGLSFTPSTLITDVLGGTTSAYRQGLGRPAMSVRDAVNAIARGEVPALPVRPVNAIPTGMNEMSGRATLDGANGLVLTWVAGATGPKGNVWIARRDLGDPDAVFGPEPPITSTMDCMFPSVVSLPGGDLMVAYVRLLGVGADVWYRRGPTRLALSAATEVQLTFTGNVGDPFIVASGGIVVLFFQIAGIYQYQRYDTTSTPPSFLDASPVPIPGASGNLHAAVDNAGNVWVASMSATTVSGIQTFRLNLTTHVMDTPASFPAAPGDFSAAPFVLCGAGQVWVFWHGTGGIWFASCTGSSWSPSAMRLPYTLPGDQNPMAALDADDRIALAYNRQVPPASGPVNIVLAHSDPNGGGWFPPAVATAATVAASTAMGDSLALNASTGGLFAGAGSLWLQWIRFNPPGSRIYYRQICSPL